MSPPPLSLFASRVQVLSGLLFCLHENIPHQQTYSLRHCSPFSTVFYRKCLPLSEMTAEATVRLLMGITDGKLKNAVHTIYIYFSCSACLFLTFWVVLDLDLLRRKQWMYILLYLPFFQSNTKHMKESKLLISTYTINVSALYNMLM